MAVGVTITTDVTVLCEPSGKVIVLSDVELERRRLSVDVEVRKALEVVVCEASEEVGEVDGTVLGEVEELDVVLELVAGPCLFSRLRRRGPGGGTFWRY